MGRWQPRHDSSGPKLISEIHSDVRRFLPSRSPPARPLTSPRSPDFYRRKRPPTTPLVASSLREARVCPACTTNSHDQTRAAVKVAINSACPPLAPMDGRLPSLNDQPRRATSAHSVAFAIPRTRPSLLDLRERLRPRPTRPRRRHDRPRPATPLRCSVVPVTRPRSRPVSDRSWCWRRGRSLWRVVRRERRERRRRRMTRRRRMRMMVPLTRMRRACRGPRASDGQATRSRRCVSWLTRVVFERC